MKKFMIVVTMITLLAGAIPAYADSVGSAIIPTMFIHYKSATNNNWVNIGLSSITNQQVTCTIKVFDYDGNDVTSTIISKVATGSSTLGNSPSIGTSPTFTIPANGSRMVQLYKGTACSIWAHAIIQWSCQDETIGKALVGSVMARSAQYGTTYVPINSGQPF